MRLLWQKWAGLFLLAMFINLGYANVAEAGLISTSSEISMGRDVAKQLEKQYGLDEDAALQDRVAKIGARLVAVCDRQGLPYTFKVLKSKEINALALPGGFIYIFRGLADAMPSDDELAGVLGHELGHVVKRHTVQQIEKSVGMSLLFGIVFGDRGAFLQNMVMEAIMAGHSRSDEREADYLGFVHSFKAGYNPYGMLVGLQKLSELDQKYHYDLFSDHPEGKARVGAIIGYMNNAKIHPIAVQNDTTAQVVDGDWKAPPFYGEYSGYKPLYRAEMTAGTLYQLIQDKKFSPDHFILDMDGVNVIVYYDDRTVAVITPQDGTGNGLSIMEFSDRYIQSLKAWGEKNKPQ